LKVEKEAQVGERMEVSQADLELIHQLSRKKLTAEEIYTFGVRLCDNEVDRDFECFELAALEELGRLFVGKSGIFDHQWSAQGQRARIYRTELVREDSIRTSTGEPYCYLKGYAYMLRTEGNRELIQEIEGGIKKEVSVGCSVRRTVCSVCGEELNDRSRCSHVKGRWYGTKLCYGILREPTDAYEWSFVAVPAQPAAGVMKQAKRREKGMLKEFLKGQPQYLEELKRLEQEAELGRRYLAGLRREVARLGGMAETNMEPSVLKGIADKLEERELLELKRAYEERLESLYPPTVQLRGAEPARVEREDEAFLV